MVRRKRRGMSLIEVLAAVFILGVGLTSISAMFVAGIISSEKAKRISTALNAMQQQMERIRSAGFSGCSVDPDIFKSAEGYSIIEQHSDMTGKVGFTVPALPNGQGVIDIDFYTSPSGYYPNLKNVTITITGSGGGVTAGRMAMQTLIANRP